MSKQYEWDVFLSHSSKDKDIVRSLKDALASEGVRVWMDEEQILPGDSIPLQVERGIDGSSHIVCCLSRNFLESEWTPAERAAFVYLNPANRGRTLIPVMLEYCEPPATIAHLRYVDYRQRARRAVDEILDALTGGTRIGHAPSIFDYNRKFRPSRTSVQDLSDTSEDFVRSLWGRLAIAVSRCHGKYSALVVADLDGFTQINEVYGVSAGDLVLDVVSATVRKACQKMTGNGSLRSAAMVRGRDEWFILMASDVSEALLPLAQSLSEGLNSVDLKAISPDLFVRVSSSFAEKLESEPTLTLMRRGLQGVASAKRNGERFTVAPRSARVMTEEQEIVQVETNLSTVKWMYGGVFPYKVQQPETGLRAETLPPTLFGDIEEGPPDMLLF